mgnify:CR=1 FL=1
MGINPLLISERLGHERVETTLNTYSHLYPSRADELAEKLNKVSTILVPLKEKGLRKNS